MAPAGMTQEELDVTFSILAAQKSFKVPTQEVAALMALLRQSGAQSGQIKHDLAAICACIHSVLQCASRCKSRRYLLFCSC